MQDVHIASELQLTLRATLQPLVATTTAIAVAVSGGMDSTMLAIHTAAEARALGLKLYFFHVHHGLYAQADEWAQQVEQLGQTLQVPVHLMPVQVPLKTGSGIEAAARQVRYEALTQNAAKLGVRHVLLAHHRDDQAETVLLRLLRGAGPTGLAAMTSCAAHQDLIYLRPWLEVSRALIEQTAQAYTAQTGWLPVNDPSNEDPHYARAALRTQVIPVLNARWPGWQTRVVRHARLAQATAQILDEVGQHDLATLAPDADARSFSLALWRQLTPARQTHVVRYWLGCHNARMPSYARLAELLKQLRQVHSLGHDRHLTWKHGEHYVHCDRGRVRIERNTPDAPGEGH
jgi:tRNA(Ile)-lysidine synthase